MGAYGISFVVEFLAWDVTNNVPKTGDVANFVLSWIKDGARSPTTNASSEVDSSNCPGLYKVTITATEAQALQGCLHGKSSTSGIVIVPTHISFVKLPDVAAGASGGILISGSNTGTTSLSGGLTANIAGNITGNLSGSVGSVTGAVGSVTGSVGSVTGAVGSVTTVNDKTGYKLASDGLDSVSTTSPTGVASNFREMLVQTWRRFFKKTTKTESEIATYADNDSSVLTTQEISSSGNDQTLGSAS